MLPKVHVYKQEIVKFIQEVSVRYGISLDYTVLEVSEVSYLAGTFQVLVTMNVQQETQPTQAPAPNFSCMPAQVNVNLSHQQVESDR